MTPNPDEPEYLKVEEVAVRRKLKEKNDPRLDPARRAAPYKLGKEWRIRRDDFDQAMAARRTTAEPARTGGLWDPGDPG
jgi:hypothetical protein